MLEIKNICYEIIEENSVKKILEDVSFKVCDSTTVVITGPNGSGKSTLAKIIMGIIKPTSGRIFFNNQDITTLSIDERANLGFGFAFQQPICFKGMTVKELLDFASKSSNNDCDACKHLSEVGLCAKDYANRKLNSKLSGGELKRIEIALVLAKNSKINIYDEPEAGIDLWSFESLVNIFKKKNKTNIIISHQQKVIDVADEIVLLNNGKIEKLGSAKKVLPYINEKQCPRLIKEFKK